jgi:phytoene/squalene synthetase
MTQQATALNARISAINDPPVARIAESSEKNPEQISDARLNAARERVPLHLDAVSRSFAFCIARLEPELREPIGLAYLLCRMLDTIEDSPWDSVAAQDQAYEHFLRALEDPSLEFAPGAETWPWERFREGEQALFRDFDSLRELWWVQRPQVKAAIADCVRSMQKGMQGFRAAIEASAAPDLETVLSLDTLGDVNRYCFFVAGIVGEMLTRVFRSVQPNFSPRPEEAWRFGLFLQKVNILKDQEADEREGRRLVPSRKLVLHSALHDAEAGWLYIQSIPSSWPGYQLFCAWSYFLGLETLVRLAQLREGEARPATSRWETLELIAQIENELAWPEAWRERREVLMQRLRSAIGEFQEQAPQEARVPWSKLAAAYQGELTAQDLLSLASD